MTHPFDAMTSTLATSDSVTIPAGWGQGRATFGGLVAGLMMSRILSATDIDPDTFRAMTVSFVAPTVPGEARIVVRTLRAGSSVTQVHAELIQNHNGTDAVCAAVLASFGTARESAVHISACPPENMTPVDQTLTVEPIEGLTPDFFAHISLHVAEGDLPFTGAQSSRMKGWMSFREPTASCGLAEFVTVVDGWPPAVLQMLPDLATASTMTWTLELLTPIGESNRQWWYEVESDATHDGYAHTHARIWDADGNPIAISRQTVAVFG